MRHATLPDYWTTPKSDHPKLAAAPYLSPHMIRRGVILIQTNCLKPHFLLPSRVELMTRCARQRRHADSPISSLSRRVRESKGAARSAPKARAIRWEKPRSESGTDPARSSIKHLWGEVGVGGFPILTQRETGMSKAKAAPKQGCTEVDAPF